MTRAGKGVERRTQHLAAAKPPEWPSRDVGSASHGETNIDWLVVAVLYSVLHRGNCLLHLWALALRSGVSSSYWTTTAGDPTLTILAASSSESHRVGLAPTSSVQKLDRFLIQVRLLSLFFISFISPHRFAVLPVLVHVIYPCFFVFLNRERQQVMVNIRDYKLIKYKASVSQQRVVQTLLKSVIASIIVV